MRNENCGNCRHYHPTVSAATLANPQGECHRNPPQLVAVALPNGGMKLSGAFVPTKPSNVCGEHSVRIAVPGAA